MGQLGPQIVAHLVADHRDIAAERRWQRASSASAPGQRLQPLEMDAVERLVEHLLGLAGARAEQAGKTSRSEPCARSRTSSAVHGVWPSAVKVS